MSVVSNTSPIIFLSKVPEILNLAKNFYKEILIPEEVFEEAVDKALQNPSTKENSFKIQELIEEKFIRIKKLDVKYIKIRDSINQKLGIGESSAICLALQLNIKLILIDEKPATSIARQFGLKPQPISLLPIKAYKKKLIDRKEAIKLLDGLLINKYHSSSIDYKKIISMLE